MTFRQLECIRAFIEEGSFSRAAQRLYISQPALSQQIISIEKEYNIQIIDRNAVNNKITEAGYCFYEYAEKILQLKEELECELGTKKHQRLCVRAIPFYANTLVPYLFSQMKKEYADVECSIYKTVASQLFRSQHMENIDFCLHAFAMHPSAEDIPEGGGRYIHEKLADEEILLVAFSEHPALQAYKKCEEPLPCVNLAKLKGQRFVVTTNSHYLKNAAEKLCRELGGFEANLMEREATFIGLMGFLQFNDCIAFLPESVLKYTNINSNVKFYKMQNAAMKRQIVASYLCGKKLTPAAKAFLNMAKELLK